MTEQTEMQLQLIDPPKIKTVKAATPDERERIAGHESGFTVPFGALRLSTNVRLDPTAEIASLAEDIRANGLLQPPAVRPYGEDETGGSVFVVETGERRYHALRALKLRDDDRVPVHLLPEVGGVERVMRQYAENAERLDLGPLDEAETLRQLIELHGLKIIDAAKLLGIDRNTAARRLLLLQLPDAGRQMIIDGEWPEIEGAQIVGRLVRDGAPAETIERLLGAGRHTAQRALERFTAEQLVTTATAQLESRGFVVVTNPKNGPAPAGYRTGIGPEFDLTKPKQFNVDDIDTVRDADGKPVVCVQLFTGAVPTAIGNLLRLVENNPAPVEPDTDNDAPLRFAVKRFGIEAQTGRRNDEIAEWFNSKAHIDADPDDVWAAVMQALVTRTHFIDLALVAQIAGVEPVIDERGKAHSEGTARRWYDECDGDTCRKIALAVVLLIGSHHAATLESGTMIAPSPLHETLFALVPDVSPVVDEQTFRGIAIAAAKAHDAALDAESGSDDE